jgi:curved DNA-binding protein CbpA
MKTHYDTLGISKSASLSEIERAFVLMTNMVCPDSFCRVNQSEEWDLANKTIRELKFAYETLRDPIKRIQYDKIVGSASQTISPISTQSPRDKRSIRVQKTVKEISAKVAEKTRIACAQLSLKTLCGAVLIALTYLHFETQRLLESQITLSRWFVNRADSDRERITFLERMEERRVDGERERLATEKERLKKEDECLRVERDWRADSVRIEQDKLILEKDRLSFEKDRLSVEQRRVEMEQYRFDRERERERLAYSEKLDKERSVGAPRN